MVLGLQPSEWAPVVTTVSLFLLVIFTTDAVASRAWADLVGLFFLAASPFLYRYLRSTVPDTMPWSVGRVMRLVSPG